MNLKKPLAFAATVTLVVGTMLSMPASAQYEFSALQGVDAQPMSPQEMNAVAGKLNAYDIAAALTALAAQSANHPKLQAADLALASYIRTNATRINATLQKLGILTPCKSCK